MNITTSGLGWEEFPLRNPTSRAETLANGRECRAESYFRDGFAETRSRGTRPHEGIDVFAPRGTEVVLPVRARIVTTTHGRGPSGRTGHGVTFEYAPITSDAARAQERIRVHFAHFDAEPAPLTVGQWYPAGTWLGNVGNTGNASGSCPHLHLHVERIARRGAAPVRINPFRELAELSPPWVTVVGMPSMANERGASSMPGQGRDRTAEEIARNPMSPEEFARQVILLRTWARGFRVARVWWEGDSTRQLVARLVRENTQRRVTDELRLVERLYASGTTNDKRVAEVHLEGLWRWARALHRYNVQLQDEPPDAEAARTVFGRVTASIREWVENASEEVLTFGAEVVQNVATGFGGVAAIVIGVGLLFALSRR